MNRRFFSELPINGDLATLADSEAHHLLHVLRAQVGEEVTLFDGSGKEFRSTVTSLGRSQVELRIDEATEVDREADLRLTLAVALPKGDRQKWLVEKCVELGVAELIPLTTQRGVAQPKPSAIKKLQRSVIEASKQCGRNRLMKIGEAVSFSNLIGNVGADGLRLICHPYDAQPLSKLAGSETENRQNVVAAVGPEGGLTDEECEQAQGAGWAFVSLGKRILRIETAAITIAAQLLAAP